MCQTELVFQALLNHTCKI